MAKIHNKAGQHGKSEAARRFSRAMSLMMFTLLALGFVGGAFLTRAMGWLAFGCFLAGAAAFRLMFPLMERVVDGWSRERIKYLRGAQAEALVAWLLGDLEDGWHVFNNLQLEDAADIDHVVVGPGGVWCVSTKGRRGLLSLSERGELLHNLKPVNWLGATKAQAMRLRERLAALLGRDVPYVTPLLAVPLMFVDLRSPCQGVHVVHQDELTDPMDKAPTRYGKADVERIAAAVEMLAKSAKALYRPPADPAAPAEPAATRPAPAQAPVPGPADGAAS